jgi:cation transport regulator
MPYRCNSELPAPLRSHLPPHAQDIYREAFNHAFGAHTSDPEQEQRAHRIAWAAVKALLREGRRQLDRPQPAVINSSASAGAKADISSDWQDRQYEDAK